MVVGTSTANNMMLASGATVTVGGTDIGAMIGETTFTIDVERYHPDLHGVMGDLEQTGFVTRAVPRLTTTMAETSYFQMTVLMDHLGISSDASTDVYGSGTLGQLASGDYQTIIASGMSTCGNKSVSIQIMHAYVSSAVNVTLSDDEITTYEVDQLCPLAQQCARCTWLYAGNTENVPLPCLASNDQVTIWGRGQSAGKSWLTPQRPHAGHPMWMKIWSGLHGDMQRPGEITGPLCHGTVSKVTGREFTGSYDASYPMKLPAAISIEI